MTDTKKQIKKLEDVLNEIDICHFTVINEEVENDISEELFNNIDVAMRDLIEQIKVEIKRIEKKN